MDEFKWKRVREWESFIVRGVRKWLCWWFRFITYSLSCEIEKSDGVFLSRGAGGGVRTRTRVSQCYALNLFIWGFCSSCKYLAVHQRVREKAMKFLFIRDNHFFSQNFSFIRNKTLCETIRIIKAVFVVLWIALFSLPHLPPLTSCE